jgi:hypothetical protein
MLESFLYTGAYKGVLVGLGLWGALIIAVYCHKTGKSPIKTMVLSLFRINEKDNSKSVEK